VQYERLYNDVMSGRHFDPRVAAAK
jgi:hypothetical protein